MVQAGIVENLTVACINWRNYLGRGQDYVDRLRSAVGRHLAMPHRFEVLTEKDLGADLQGWWVKLKLFQPGRFQGTVLYLDLDVVLTAPIDPIVQAAVDGDRLYMRDDFGYPMLKPRAGIGADTQRLLGGPGTMNSSVMVWQGGATGHLWEAWQERKVGLMAALHGDQNALTQLLWPARIGLLPPQMIQSFKYGVQLERQRPAPVVVFHGQPKPHEVPDRWVREAWQ
jgi:hypothetical protein